MVRYPALLEHENGLYGVIFPDLNGCVSMGETLDEALVNAEEALRLWTASMDKEGWEYPPPTPFDKVEVPAGNALTLVPLIRPSGTTVRANLTLEEDVLEFIDDEAKRRGMTRKSYVTWMARRIAQMGG